MIEFGLFIALELQIGFLFYLIMKKQAPYFEERPKRQDTVLRSMTKAITYKEVSGKKMPVYHDEESQWLKEQEQK